MYFMKSSHRCHPPADSMLGRMASAGPAHVIHVVHTFNELNNTDHCDDCETMMQTLLIIY